MSDHDLWQERGNYIGPTSLSIAYFCCAEDKNVYCDTLFCGSTDMIVLDDSGDGELLARV